MTRTRMTRVIRSGHETVMARRPLRTALGGLAFVLVAACSGPATLDGPVEWTDEDGQPVDPALVALTPDPCGSRPGVAFLDVTWPFNPGANEETEMRRYVRDPELVFPPTALVAPYDAASSLSSDARFTGYSGGPFQLWAGSDDELYLYLTDGPRVEALPLLVGDDGC